MCLCLRSHLGFSFSFGRVSAMEGVDYGPSGSESYEEVTEEAHPESSRPAGKAAAGAKAVELSSTSSSEEEEPVSTCRFCWSQVWGGASGMERHQNSSGKCRQWQKRLAVKQRTSAPEKEKREKRRKEEKKRGEKKTEKQKPKKEKKKPRSPSPPAGASHRRRRPPGAQRQLRVERMGPGAFLLTL